MRLLFDLIIDAYDDIRAEAAYLLCHLPHSALEAALTKQTTVDGKVSSLIARAHSFMIRSGRADHADGNGRLVGLRIESQPQEAPFSNDQSLYPLVESLVRALEDDVQAGVDNLVTAVSSAPVHARFVELRYT